VKPEEERRDIRSYVRNTWYQVDRRNPEALDGGFAVGRPLRVTTLRVTTLRVTTLRVTTLRVTTLRVTTRALG